MANTDSALSLGMTGNNLKSDSMIPPRNLDDNGYKLKADGTIDKRFKKKR